MDVKIYQLKNIILHVITRHDGYGDYSRIGPAELARNTAVIDYKVQYNFQSCHDVHIRDV